MSKNQSQIDNIQATERLPPLNLYPDEQSSRCRCWIRTVDDDGLSFALRQEARLRASTDEDIFNHLIGIAGEYAVSGFYGVPVNREIYSDYEGDDGYDLELYHDGERRRIEVKTVYEGKEELVVQKDRIDDADYFVLCRTINPTTMVELIGRTTRPRLKEFGERYPKKNTIHLDSRYLESFPATEISPDKVRKAQVSGSQ